MNELSYWLLRCENQLFTTVDKTTETIFPRGCAGDFGNPKGALLVGQ